MFRYIDAHSHLYCEEFVQDFDDVLLTAKENGVEASLLCAESAQDFPRILKLAEEYPEFCIPCFGSHPVQHLMSQPGKTIQHLLRHHAYGTLRYLMGQLVPGYDSKEARSTNIKDLEEALPHIEEHHERLVAIGEVGLDFTPWYCKSDEDKENQRAVLRKYAELSLKFDLPLNVHSRSAGRPTIALLKEAGATKVLLHAFDGRPAVAMEGVRAGYYFSIPPSIVRSEQKQKLVKQLPLENILLETDSPSLGPEKEGRNEPKNIQISCEYIAQIKKLDKEVVAKMAWENTVKLFPKISKYIKK